MNIYQHIMLLHTRGRQKKQVWKKNTALVALQPQYLNELKIASVKKMCLEKKLII